MARKAKIARELRVERIIKNITKGKKRVSNLINLHVPEIAENGNAITK